MNRKQFLSFSGKLKKKALELENDARRVRVTGHPGDEIAELLREQAEGIRRVAELVEEKFG
jgi:hypothetical protein